MSIFSSFVVSFLVLCAMILFFRHEARRGKRYGESLRSHLDIVIVRLLDEIHAATRFFGRDLIRQVIHYSFHTVLQMLLRVMRRIEKSLQQTIRINKGIAKNIERESVLENRLEAIALHKIETTLTEKERKAHKEKSLNGL